MPLPASLESPISLIASFGLDAENYRSYESWWWKRGTEMSETVDRAGTPWLRMYDRQGKRVDEIVFPASYRKMLERGYREGIVWRFRETNSLIDSYLLTYVTSFFDPGLSCPYIVSLSTALSLEKYGSEAVKQRFLAPLMRRGQTVWQGATWMTEIKGGSDLGATVETTARRHGDRWMLDGSKYFASNVGAEVAVVAARPEDAPEGVRGLSLFAVPRDREEGGLNYTIRRMKNKIGTRAVPTGEVVFEGSEAYLLGTQDRGIYLILEVLNVSRVANAVASVALAQRAIHEALTFAREREAFDRTIVEHPLLNRQFEDRFARLRQAFALAWEAVRVLDEVWHETPPYSDRYHLFRLLAHLAKYWTAEIAKDTAMWAIEVHGGMGTLAEYPAERWFREAIILSIWEGTPHRQILDGLEVMEKRDAHRLLLAHLSDGMSNESIEEMSGRIEDHLSLPREDGEARAESLIEELAEFAADAVLNQYDRGVQSSSL